MEIKDLVDAVKGRENFTQIIKGNLRLFSGFLFDSLEEIIVALIKEGINSIKEVKRERLKNNFEKFSFVWEEERLIFVASDRIALPIEFGSNAYEGIVNRKDTGMAARMVVFVQPLDERLDGFAMHNYYLFCDKTWLSLGANSYPRYETSIDNKIVYSEAMRFVATLSKNNNRTWRKLADTEFEHFIKNVFPPEGYKKTND